MIAGTLPSSNLEARGKSSGDVSGGGSRSARAYGRAAGPGGAVTWSSGRRRGPAARVSRPAELAARHSPAGRRPPRYARRHETVRASRGSPLSGGRAPSLLRGPRRRRLRALASVWWSAPGGGRGGRWRRAGAARARPGAAFAARGGAGTPRRAPARLDALMEPPWELELELRRHIETCQCTCDHMGYGNYMDYQVAPAAHACLCRAITSPHAHVRVVCSAGDAPLPALSPLASSGPLPHDLAAVR
ncbi:hypothetical protein PYW08_013370 [Mythimna loreyi]|uniref:Uncharacterized protein n=1 Tax=Mythimna loreyi TaxID=667449 RepID=A0ACC2QHC9_9NEOP|nr:hypothetical protein PYW08_013370 [Mythimna loreyi]